MALNQFTTDQLLDLLERASAGSWSVDPPVLSYVRDELKGVSGKLSSSSLSWRDFEMFWPPRLVEALRMGAVVPFFGSGVSFAAGIPTWDRLLREHFDIGEAFDQEEDLAHDFLTRAEVAAQQVGANRLQAKLRELTNAAQQPTSSHILIAALRAPVMITTNYDVLLERAWALVNSQVALSTAVNDRDIQQQSPFAQYAAGGNKALLLKVHGCAGRSDEQLVLTRRDYRHHYRVNVKFFATLEELLSERHVLFLGFSHRDPEVGRLVDSAIYRYEDPNTPGARPHFYSLQFDMRRSTPEIFAARGLVALNPPLTTLSSQHNKGGSVCQALSDLVVIADTRMHNTISLDSQLETAVKSISRDIASGLKLLDGYESEAFEILSGQTPARSLDDLLSDLGPRAGQGVYLADNDGNVNAFSVPVGLSTASRDVIPELPARPYFREAKTFRVGFVSDSVASKFNGHSTVFFCKPLENNHGFAGLLFAASQIGVWTTPMDVAAPCWSAGLSFMLVDGEGILLMPHNREFRPVTDNLGPDQAEPGSLNVGYRYNLLRALSRRDALARHVTDNIVPLSQDDDVLRLPPDVEYYSVVSQIPNTSWKLALSRLIER